MLEARKIKLYSLRIPRDKYEKEKLKQNRHFLLARDE